MMMVSWVHRPDPFKSRLYADDMDPIEHEAYMRWISALDLNHHVLNCGSCSLLPALPQATSSAVYLSQQHTRPCLTWPVAALARASVESAMKEVLILLQGVCDD